MNSKEDKIIADLIKGGLIGAGLGALLSKDKGEGIILGAVAGAALLASFNANKAAKKTNVPLLIEEDNVIYRISKDGSRVRVKKITSVEENIPKKFKLK